MSNYSASHIVRRSVERRGIWKNLDLSPTPTGRSFESRACERSGDLKNRRATIPWSFQSDSFWHRPPIQASSCLPALLGPGNHLGADKNCWRKRWLENYYSKKFCLSYTFSLYSFSYSYILAWTEYGMEWYGMIHGMFFWIHWFGDVVRVEIYLESNSFETVSLVSLTTAKMSLWMPFHSTTLNSFMPFCCTKWLLQCNVNICKDYYGVAFLHLACIHSLL